MSTHEHRRQKNKRTPPPSPLCPPSSDADPAPLFAAHALAAPAPPSWGPLAADPDALLTRMYRYYCEGGAAALIAARVLNLAALAVAAFFAFLSLLVVRWDALSLPCVKDGTCDIADVALDWRPLARGATPRAVAVLALLAAFALYWLAAAAHAVTDARGAIELIMLLPGKTAAMARQSAASVVVRYLGGDMSLVQEVMTHRQVQAELDPEHPARIPRDSGAVLTGFPGMERARMHGACRRFTAVVCC